LFLEQEANVFKVRLRVLKPCEKSRGFLVLLFLN
jgi:hypothetical protein